MAQKRKGHDDLPKDEADRRRDERALRILRSPPQPRKPKDECKPTAEKSKSPEKPSKRPSASEMLTDSELQSLRQEASETSAYAKKLFAHLRPK